jgi:hypothetical protein
MIQSQDAAMRHVMLLKNCFACLMEEIVDFDFVRNKACEATIHISEVLAALLSGSIKIEQLSPSYVSVLMELVTYIQMVLTIDELGG